MRIWSRCHGAASAQGNILAGEHVVKAMARTFETTKGELSERLMAALEAGQAAGGDARGMQAGGILVVKPIDDPFDQGYVTVTTDHRLEISARLRADYQNGRTYYPLHGTAVRLPGKVSEQPDPELLRWHNENVFLI